jgi:uncharacterized membrane protein
MDFNASSAARSAVTQDECTMATLAHVLQVVGWWIGPFVIFFLRPQSRFVRFHALQALLLQAIHVILWMAIMAAWFVVMFGTISHSRSSAPPAGLFIFFPLVWLLAMGWWVLIIVVAIVYAIKAGRGEWAEYPVLGRVAREILKIGPGGAV